MKMKTMERTMKMMKIELVWTLIERIVRPPRLPDIVKTGIFASNMAGYTGCYASLVSCHHLLRNFWAELHLLVVLILTAVHSDVGWSLASASAAAVRLCSDQQPRSGLSWLETLVTEDQCQAWSAVTLCPADCWDVTGMSPWSAATWHLVTSITDVVGSATVRASLTPSIVLSAAHCKWAVRCSDAEKICAM